MAGAGARRKMRDLRLRRRRVPLARLGSQTWETAESGLDRLESNNQHPSDQGRHAISLKCIDTGVVS
jgi:hypothetical protein